MPRSAARTSRRRKRRSNFAVARRSAASGSISSLRARLATANKRSPSSSSILAASAPGVEFGFEFADLLGQLGEDRPRLGPIKADPRRATLHLRGAEQGRESERHPVEDAFAAPRRFGPGRPLARLVLLPGRTLRRRRPPDSPPRGRFRGNLDIAEDMRVTAHHLVGDRRGNRGEIEQPRFFGEARVKDDLK